MSAAPLHRWRKAPAWARYAAADSVPLGEGNAWWYEYPPTIPPDGDAWAATKGRFEQAKYSINPDTWRKSLEMRPNEFRK